MAALPPNILWILTTQWRARTTGYAGDRDAATPHLDAWAAKAWVHTAAVTPHPFGPFARAAILTGIACPANGVREYFDPLPLQGRTIAHDLRDRGYATAWFGKWHLWRRDPNAALVGEAHARIVVPPEARGGFELWEGFESGFLLNDPWLHGTRLPEPVRVPGYQSDILCRRADEWMHAASTDPRPWFGVVSLESPHPPYDAPAPCPRPDPDNLTLGDNVPRGGPVEERARRELAGYHAHIAATDRAVGRLMDAVDRLAQRSGRPTVAVFTSVHGDMHGAHGQFRKGWPHEESIGVPMLVCRLGQLSSGKDDRPRSLMDLHPMTLAWAEGRMWQRKEDAVEISMPSVVQLPHQCDRIWHGLRGHGWKVIFNEDGSPWLVFDLERDPWEMENLVHRVRGRELIARARV